MVTEHVVLSVHDGVEDEFEAAFAEAKHVIAAAPGCRSVRLSRSVETPSDYLLLVEWDTVDDHMVGFRNSDAFTEWRRLLAHFYTPGTLEHFEPVDSA